MVRLQDIIDEMRLYSPEVNVDSIKRAYVYSAKVHQGQTRRSGEPYLVHPMGVAHIIAKLHLDESSVVAGLLHDTLEDTLATPEEIEELFGATVRFLVEGLTKLTKVSFSSGQQKQAENVRKMLVAMSEDIRVILIKLADRLHNMRTLDHLDDGQRQAMSMETMEIYAPLANRLGIQWVRTELEDLAFKYLHPDRFTEIEDKLAQLKRERHPFIEKTIHRLEKVLEENTIKAQVAGRLKHYYSIYKKMLQKNLDFDQVYDIIAFRIITETIGDCYRVLGLIHAMWKPLPGRFKDYIAMPKINRYQSLHTTVLALPTGERVEIQIRTRDMHGVAEQGIAAHWVYKEGGKSLQQSKDLAQFGWLRELLEKQKDMVDPAEFLETVKVDLFSDEVFAFTPKGDVKALPRGATALDFAYAIHSEVGHHCVGAKINGKIAPLRQKLKNGDTIEILTSTKQKPSKDWLAFVRTSMAKNKIRAVIRAEQRKRSQEIGREILEKECKRRGINLARKWKMGDIARAAEELEYKNTEELLVALGYGKISPSRITEKLEPPAEEKVPAPEAAQDAEDLSEKIAQVFKKPGKKSKSGILVQGLDDVMVRFAKCCHPIPGDSLIGVITRGRGVTVHTEGCQKLSEIPHERRIEVNWDSSHEFQHNVGIRITSDDRPGLLANISAVLADSKVNILSVHAKVEKNANAICNFVVGVGSLEQLQDVIKKIEKIRGVHAAERVQG